MRKNGFAPAWALIILLASACSSSTNAPGASAPATGGTLRIAVGLDPGKLDARLQDNTVNYRAVDLVYDGLIYLDGKLKPQPDLAEKWSNPEPTVWLFNLRKGVKWHDGQDFTADDVVYTYSTVLDPNFKSPLRSLYAAISKVEAIDPLTVKFTTSAPYAPLLVYMDLGIVPKHIGEKNDNSLTTNPIGTGPFKFVSWTRNASLEFAANKDFWAGAPKLDGIRFVEIPDYTQEVNALEAGDVDIVEAPFVPQDIPRLQANKNVTFTTYDSVAITYLNFNVSDPLMSNLAVRQAIASLIDRETIASTIYQNFNKPAQSIIPPISFAYSKEITGPAYSPSKAAEYLTAAGYNLESGSWKKDGKDLTITLNTQSDDSGRVQQVEYLQNVFTKFGIKVTVSLADFATFFANTQAGKYQIALLGWTKAGLDPDIFYPMFTPNGSNNWSKYNNPQAAKLLTDGRAELDQAKRTVIYQNLAKIIANDVVYVVMQYDGNAIAITNKVQGFELNPRAPMQLRMAQRLYLLR